ncbi:MAG: hypothetical protein L3J67_12550 [Hyphomicrobiaceae bacterium]|nr:hypothetical protein [Hyphomicrobiaceae bacterium]
MMSTSKERRLAVALAATTRELIVQRMKLFAKEKDYSGFENWAAKLKTTQLFETELVINDGDMPYDRVIELCSFANSLCFQDDPEGVPA